MKLYNAPAPNPRRVRIFIQEKGLDIPREDVAIQEMVTRTSAFKAINSLGELPVLELDDGTHLTESVAICRYLEALHPNPPLFGRNAREQGLVEMWNRRAELHFFAPIGNVARHTFDFFKDTVEQVPAFAESQRREAHARYAWLDNELSDGREWLVGDYFSVADITAMTASMVSEFIGEPVPEALKHLKAYETRLRDRPSWNA